MTTPRLSERQIETLHDLYRLMLKPQQCRFQKVTSKMHNIAPSAWATPLDFGAHSRSHHSQTAMQLARRGLVDRYNYHTDSLNYFAGRTKGACVYRITAAGIAELTTRGLIK